MTKCKWLKTCQLTQTEIDNLTQEQLDEMEGVCIVWNLTTKCWQGWDGTDWSILG